MSKNRKKSQFPKDEVCFWCGILITKNNFSREHLSPLGMGSKDSKIVTACRKCNEERGKVTELYSDRLSLVKYSNRHPERATSYKNNFRKKVRKMGPIILKWEYLHRQKNIILPYSLMEIIKLDEIMPIGF